MHDALARQYGIAPVFLSRYFERNAERRFATQMLEFMLWRRGTFIPPQRKEQALQTFLAEEIDSFYNKGLLNLPQIQFAVTTRCTLRCKNCNAFMPYFGTLAPHEELSPEDFARDLARLAKAVGAIRRFMLLGGEPLLHPRFAEVLAAAAEQKMAGVVEIVTNGTIIPGDDVLRVAETYRHKLYFHISNYAVNPALASRLRHDAILAVLKERGIRYQMSPNPVWFQEVPLAERHSDDAQVQEQFAACWMKRTLEVKNGAIAICPKASSGYALGMVDAPAAGEVVNLRESRDIRQELVAFYHRNIFEACRSCVRIDEQVLPAEQMQAGSAHEPESGIFTRQNPREPGKRRIH